MLLSHWVPERKRQLVSRFRRRLQFPPRSNKRDRRWVCLQGEISKISNLWTLEAGINFSGIFDTQSTCRFMSHAHRTAAKWTLLVKRSTLSISHDHGSSSFKVNYFTFLKFKGNYFFANFIQVCPNRADQNISADDVQVKIGRISMQIGVSSDHLSFDWEITEGTTQ